MMHFIITLLIFFFLAMDDRMSHFPNSRKNMLPIYLSTFAQEKGRICRYTKRSCNLPRIYLNSKLYSALKNNLRSDCAYYNYFVKKEWIDPKVKYDQSKFKLTAKEGHIDSKAGERLPRKNHFLLVAEPQCGKTGVYLHLISLLRAEIEGASFEVDMDIESDEEDDSTENHEDIDQFRAVVPYWKNLTELDLPKTVSHCKYTRITGPYHYPVEVPPDFPGLVIRNKSKQKVSVNRHSPAVFTAQHSDELCSYTMPQKSLTIPIPQITSETFSINYPVHTHYEELFKNKTVPDEMICIMTPSFGKFTNARLNYNHLMLDADGTVKPFIHLVFVRKNQFKKYREDWGNLVGLIEIPNEMTDIPEGVDVNNGGIGYSRRFIQRLVFY